MPLCALDWRFSAEREKEPLTGMVWLNAAAILARPWPINSWFSFQGRLVLIAITLQLDMASMKLIRAMTNAAGSSSLVVSQSMVGTTNCGNPCGTAPTTRPPSSAKPIA